MDKKALAFVGLAFELAALVVAFIYIGQYFDLKYNLKGLGIAGGALGGLIVWVAHVAIVLKSFERSEEKSSQNP